MITSPGQSYIQNSLALFKLSPIFFRLQFQVAAWLFYVYVIASQCQTAVAADEKDATAALDPSREIRHHHYRKLEALGLVDGQQLYSIICFALYLSLSFPYLLLQKLLNPLDKLSWCHKPPLSEAPSQLNQLFQVLQFLFAQKVSNNSNFIACAVQNRLNQLI